MAAPTLPACLVAGATRPPRHTAAEGRAALAAIEVAVGDVERDATVADAMPLSVEAEPRTR